MPAPIDFPNSTNVLGLPLLFTGQAQKEFFVNQAFAMIDALLHRTVVGSGDAPPVDAVDGNVYRVTALASGAWAGKEDALAVQIAGYWHFVAPLEGMCVFDRSSGQRLIFRNQWEAANAPTEPSGGAVVDTEARAAINALLNELSRVGIIG